MTEKRFNKLTSSIDYYEVWDCKEEKGLTVEDAIGLLNELHEENEQLKNIESKVYKDFSEKTLRILAKYEIENLEKLDRILFEQKVW